MRELSALRNPRIWVMIAVGSVGFGGFFAVYSYIAEVTTRETGFAPSTVPWVLACLGIGMTIGNVLGGWATDRSPRRTVTWGFGAFIVALVLYTQFAWHPVGLFVCVFMLGVTSSLLIPSIQSRLVRISDEAALLGAAINHAAFNIGNSLGAWLGGVVIAAGLGYLAPGWVGVVLAAVGLSLVLLSNAVERRDKAKGLNTVGISVVE